MNESTNDPKLLVIDDEAKEVTGIHLEAMRRVIDRLPNKVRMQIRSHERNGKIGRPRADLAVGEGVNVYVPDRDEPQMATVKRIKADGRVTLVDLVAPWIGAGVKIKDVWYLVLWVKGVTAGLCPATDEQMQETVWTSEKIEILEMPEIKILITNTGPTPAQQARRERKANRARGVLQRKMERAAKRAPAGSIGAAMAGGA